MTEKYELRLCNDGNYYLYHKGVLINAPYISFDKFNKEDAESIIGELNHLSNENEQLKQDRFICLDCNYGGYTEIGCLCEKQDNWEDFKNECNDFKELKY